MTTTTGRGADPAAAPSTTYVAIDAGIRPVRAGGAR